MKIPDTQKVAFTLYLSLANVQALRDLAAERSTETGKKITPSVIVDAALTQILATCKDDSSEGSEQK